MFFLCGNSFTRSIESSFVAFFLVGIGKLLSYRVDIHQYFILPILVLYLLLFHYNGPTSFVTSSYGNLELWSIPIMYVESVCYFVILRFVFRRIEGSKLSSTFAYLGRHSLRLLCIHMFVFAVSSIFYKIGIPVIILGFILTFCVDSILEYLFHKIKKRLPICAYL